MIDELFIFVRCSLISRTRAYLREEQQRLETSHKNSISEWDIEEIEQRKVDEEQKAFEDGDLLCTFPDPESLPRQRQLYIREKARLRSEIMIRKLTGRNWITKVEERSKRVYWYSTDTGEALWGKPQVLIDLQEEDDARANGWSTLPPKILIDIFDYLVPFPERTAAAAGTCRNWRLAANDPSFVLHVWPVELGALIMSESKFRKKHFRTVAEAVESALPGDTIEMGDGNYYVKSGLVVDKPVKLVGDEDNLKVALEVSGTIEWRARGGYLEGLTLHRPSIASAKMEENDMLTVAPNCRLDMFRCVVDNAGSDGNCVFVGEGSRCHCEKVRVCGASAEKCGLRIESEATVDLIDVSKIPPRHPLSPSLCHFTTIRCSLLCATMAFRYRARWIPTWH